MTIGFIGLSTFLCAQAPTSTRDADQIKSLMAALSNHSKMPAEVLNPNLSTSDRDKNLERLSAPNYELSIVPEAAPTIANGSAAAPVRVHFNDQEGNTLDASATAHFIKVGNTWYFSNFDFMRVPLFLIFVIVVCALIGIAYATTVLVLWRRLMKQGRFGIDAVKVFFPIFWPSLFRAVP
jgi:hypothetical protein